MPGVSAYAQFLEILKMETGKLDQGTSSGGMGAKFITGNSHTDIGRTLPDPTAMASAREPY